MQRVLDRLSATLDAHGTLMGSVLLGCLFIVTLGYAAGKLLWYDELVTIGVASFPTAADVYRFFYTGLDTTSATPALLAHLSLKLHASPEIALRLPFIAAFLVTLACVYLFVRRRYPAGYALATCVALVLPKVVSDQAVEARSYAMSLMGTGLAMVCWQAAERGARGRLLSILGLWGGLAFAVNVHSFGIFLFVPFAMAQIVRDARRRRPDWPVWAALCLFPLGVAPVLHGQRIAKVAYGGNFWSAPHPYLVLDSYREVLFGADILFLATMFLFAVGTVYARRRWAPAVEAGEGARSAGFSAPEWTLVLVLGLMPFYALPASYLIHVYRTIYVLPFAIGLVIALVAVLAEQAFRSRDVGTALFAVLLLLLAPRLLGPAREGLRALLRPNGVHAGLAAEFKTRPWVRSLEASPLPPVVGDYYDYTQLWFYAPEDLKARLVYLTDFPEMKKYPADATTQTNFLLFGPQLGYRTSDARVFLHEHPHFLLGIRPDLVTWLPDFLLTREKQGSATLDLLGPIFDGSKHNVSVFEVQARPENADVAGVR